MVQGDILVWNAAALAEFFRSPSAPIARDLFRRGLAVESEAKRLLNTSFPPPSSPGEPPHKRSARLQTSISTRLGEDAEGIYVDIGTAVEYGEYLEFGTARMEARPFLRPALPAAAL